MSIWLGFLLGITGSLHCVGMCGPIAYLLPIKKGSNQNLQRFQYHFGRVITYTILGLFFGLLGKFINLSFFHQGLSIVVGSFLIIWSMGSFTSYFNKSNRGLFYRFENTIRNLLFHVFKAQTNYRMLLIGMLNGLLPCGLVYVAISGSIYYANPFVASLFMTGFGLGTIPLLYIVQHFPKNKLRFKNWNVKTLLSLLAFLMGLLIILRGLGLGIPFFSPANERLNLIESTHQECKP